MALDDLQEKINHEIQWRVDEISMIKTIPILYPFSNKQKETWQKHSIPIFYSLWEGFVVECFSHYSEEINSMELSKNDICLNLLTHSLDVELNLKNGRVEFNTQKQLVNTISTCFSKPIYLKKRVPTGSNVNLKAINDILTRFNLDSLPENLYESKLNKLLKFRNSLAHGEFSIPITQESVDELSATVIECMHAVAAKILDGCKNRTYMVNYRP